MFGRTLIDDISFVSSRCFSYYMGLNKNTYFNSCTRLSRWIVNHLNAIDREEQIVSTNRIYYSL